MVMSKVRKRKRSQSANQADRQLLGPTNDAPPLVSKREVAVVLALLLAGVALRCALPSRMGVEHFDEGVYASNVCFGAESNYQYPARHLYAPPLLPTLIQWSIIAERIFSPGLSRASTLAVLAPSLLAGCLTLVAVWWMAREWFGAATGMAALALAALSDLHALYSRTALTEPLLLLFLVTSLWAAQRALSQTSARFVACAGVLVGVAWWTKYNGWLPLAIVLASIGLKTMVGRMSRRYLTQSVVCWAGMACVAFVVWAPYLWQLQQVGGYADVAENHKKYVVGLSGWFASLEQQYANLMHYDGWVSCVGLAIASLVAAARVPTIAKSPLRWQPVRCSVLALSLAAMTAWVGSFVVMFGLAMVFAASVLRRPKDGDASDETASWPWALSVAWIVGLFVTTPMYHPYPRLTLPWICGLWLAGAAGLSEVLKAKYFSEVDVAKRDGVAIGFGAIALVTLGLAAATGRLPLEPPAWQSRAMWQPIADEIIDEMSAAAERATNDPDRAIAYVYSEPALFFHIEQLGNHGVVPAGDAIFGQQLSFQVPAFFIAGPEFYRRFPKADMTRLLRTYEYTPSDLVALNFHHPRELRSGNGITWQIKVFRIGTPP